MNIEKIFKLAKRFEKKSQHHKHLSNLEKAIGQFEADYLKQNVNAHVNDLELEKAVQQFVADYIHGASINDLRGIKNEIDQEIREAELEIERALYNPYEGDLPEYLDVPESLSTMRKLVGDALSRLGHKD
jgi:hypothetical protein